MSRKYTAFVFAICGIGLLITVVLSLSVGAIQISPPKLFRAFWDGAKTTDGRVIYFVRLPRCLASLAAGASLAVSGVVIQTVLNNPLAGPGIIGVNAGAGFLMALGAVILPGAVFAFPLFAFFGALCSVFLVYGIAKYSGASRMTIVLSGVAVSSMMSAGINTLTALFPDILTGMRDFSVGGFYGVGTANIMPAVIAILICLILLVLLGGELEILGLGEETASALGLNAKKYRFIFLTLAAVLAGAAVSFAGLLGFVGLIVPHAARLLLKGQSKRAILAASAILGAIFLNLCDTAARTLFAPFELPVGILISFLGAPFFLWLLYSQRRKRRD